jgi:hypothetical protein
MAPGRPETPSFFVSGVSHVVSVVLVTFISIALLAIVFIFGSAYIGSQSAGNPSISIIEARILSISPGKFLVKVTVGNPGSVDVTVSSISIQGVSCSASPNTSLKPGQTYSASLTCTGLTPLQKYAITVSGTSRRGEKVGDVAWVIAEA